tara:strand:- start:4937 stop:5242 length:306 start_codon:yes stop_codon:yes gene_type:complete
MAKIINFPNSPKTTAQKDAELMELKKIEVETTLQIAMSSDLWDHYVITKQDIDNLAQFGEVMTFPPIAAARLISKLAEYNRKLAAVIDISIATEEIIDPWK